MKTAEELKQEFKELNAYLDDLYNNHKEMDAGNLWIQFTDKFNAFQKSILHEYSSHGADAVAYQLCPKCNGIAELASTLICDVCKGEKIVPMHQPCSRNQENGSAPVRDWVKVEDRLPENIGSYLCFWENCYVGMLFFNSNKEWCEMWQQEKHKPTHWMPLPAPPTNP